MAKILLGTILILVFGLIGFAQSRKNSTKRNVPRSKTGTVQLSNLSRNASELEAAGSNFSCGGVTTLTGTIIRREFDENGIMLIGFVIRQASDVRTFVNIDADYVAESDGLLPGKLSLLLGKGKKVKIWAISCENGNFESLPRSLFLNMVRAL